MKSLQRTRTIFLAGALLLGPVLGSADAAGTAGYDPRRDPAADVKAAVRQAQPGGKRILLEVGGEWCPWCHVLHELVTTDEEIAAKLRDGFVVVKVNWSPENENTRFLSAYPPIPAYPHFFVLDSKGTYLWSQSGSGFEKGRTAYDRGKVLAFLKQWSPPKPKKTAR
jgi:thiol:disulfide interchange protein